jgi:hypothetical protein
VIGVLLYLVFSVGVVADAVRRGWTPGSPLAILSIAAASGFVGNPTHSLLLFQAGLTMAFARVECSMSGNP